MDLTLFIAMDSVQSMTTIESLYLTLRRNGGQSDDRQTTHRATINSTPTITAKRRHRLGAISPRDQNRTGVGSVWRCRPSILLD